jgi:uncharacterized protein YukE
MSEDQKTKQAPQEDVKEKPAGTPDTISSLFDERDRLPSEEKDDRKAPEQSTPKASASSQGEQGDQKKSNAPAPQQKEAPTTPKEEEGDDSSPELETLKGELDKTRKSLSENQKYGRQNAQKVKNALKVAQTLVSEGALTTEEARGLLETLQSEEDDIEEYHKGDSHPFAPIFRIANKELENIRKYTDDPLLQDKVDAFDYFLSVSSPEDIKEALKELIDLTSDPVKLTKKMLSIGQKAYEESYKEIKEAGGYKNVLSQKNQDVEKLQKKIDKLEKKLSHYEDFDKPRYRMDEMGESDGGTSPKDTISALFDERDKRSNDTRKA